MIFARFWFSRTINEHDEIQAGMTKEPKSGTNFCVGDSVGDVESRRRVHEEVALHVIANEAGGNGFLALWVLSLYDFLENRASRSLIEFSVGPCCESSGALGMKVQGGRVYERTEGPFPTCHQLFFSLPPRELPSWSVSPNARGIPEHILDGNMLIPLCHMVLERWRAEAVMVHRDILFKRELRVVVARFLPEVHWRREFLRFCHSGCYRSGLE